MSLWSTVPLAALALLHCAVYYMCTIEAAAIGASPAGDSCILDGSFQKTLSDSKEGWVKVLPGCFPYFISIRKSSGSVHMCGGLLISKRLILTAGHCFGYTMAENPIVTIEPGGWNLEIRADDIIRHPEWDGGIDNDLAIIPLREDIAHRTSNSCCSAFPDSHQYPQLVKRNLEVYASIPVFAFRMDAGLRIAQFVVVDKKHCSEKLGWGEGMLCVYSKNAELFDGMSGGPVVLIGFSSVENVTGRTPWLDLAVGIVSASGKLEGSLALVLISAYRDWIDEVMRKFKSTGAQSTHEELPLQEQQEDEELEDERILGWGLLLTFALACLSMLLTLAEAHARVRRWAHVLPILRAIAPWARHVGLAAFTLLIIMSFFGVAPIQGAIPPWARHVGLTAFMLLTTMYFFGLLSNRFYRLFRLPVWNSPP